MYDMPQDLFYGLEMLHHEAHVLWQAFDQATMSHGLNAQQVDDLPRCHVLSGHMTDSRDVAFT